MKLLTSEMRKKLPKYKAQENSKDPTVYLKFFHVFSSWYWFVTEGEPVLDNDGIEVDFHFFGYVKGDFPEWGTFALSELESINLRGLPMERDKFFSPQPWSKVKEDYKLYDSVI